MTRLRCLAWRDEYEYGHQKPGINLQQAPIRTSLYVSVILPPASLPLLIFPRQATSPTIAADTPYTQVDIRAAGGTTMSFRAE